jgi:ADP-heptose:LPS heptosyltransferase
MNVSSLLILKHGALGDMLKAFGACRFLREFYPAAEITLLTTPPYKSLSLQTGYFNRIVLDSRSWNVWQSFLMLKSLARQNFDLVIDFQNSRRTNRYYKIWRLLSTTPWCGTAKDCDYSLPMSLKNEVHIYDRFAKQLQLLGLNAVEQKVLPTLEWIADNPHLQYPPVPYALLIPGSSPVSLEKRWPVESYAQIALYLSQQGITPIVVGGTEEQELARKIQNMCPLAWDMTTKTSLVDLGNLAKKARVIIGNDTGPLYLASASAQPTIVLWSAHSNPFIHAPRGKNVIVLQQDDLRYLSLEKVQRALQPYLTSRNVYTSPF